MEISDIVFEQSSGEEFAQLHKFWYPQSIIIEKCNKAKILNPINFHNYSGLIEWFLESPYSYQINIYDKEKWKKYKTKNVDDKQMSELKSIKEHTVDNINIVDLIFNIRKSGCQRLKTRFCKHKDMYIGYAMLFCEESYYKFNWKCEPNLYKRMHIHGLSNPPL